MKSDLFSFWPAIWPILLGASIGALIGYFGLSPWLFVAAIAAATILMRIFFVKPQAETQI